MHAVRGAGPTGVHPSEEGEVESEASSGVQTDRRPVVAINATGPKPKCVLFGRGIIVLSHPYRSLLPTRFRAPGAWAAPFVVAGRGDTPVMAGDCSSCRVVPDRRCIEPERQS